MVCHLPDSRWFNNTMYSLYWFVRLRLSNAANENFETNLFLICTIINTNRKRTKIEAWWPPKIIPTRFYTNSDDFTLNKLKFFSANLNISFQRYIFTHIDYKQTMANAKCTKIVFVWPIQNYIFIKNEMQMIEIITTKKSQARIQK